MHPPGHPPKHFACPSKYLSPFLFGTLNFSSTVKLFDYPVQLSTARMSVLGDYSLLHQRAYTLPGFSFLSGQHTVSV